MVNLESWTSRELCYLRIDLKGSYTSQWSRMEGRVMVEDVGSAGKRYYFQPFKEPDTPEGVSMKRIPIASTGDLKVKAEDDSTLVMELNLSQLDLLMKRVGMPDGRSDN